MCLHSSPTLSCTSQQPLILQNTAAIRPLFFKDIFQSGLCLPKMSSASFNKALLFHPGLSMTMTWFPWDFYGNWLILCNLIKALGSTFFFFYKKNPKKNSGWKYGALLKIGGLAATWQAGHIPCIDPLHREYRRTHTLSLSAHFTNLLQFHGLCRVFPPSPLVDYLYPFMPMRLYICLLACPSLSLTTLLPLISPIALLWSRGGSRLLCFDWRVLSADISLWSTLSVAELGRA